MHFSTLFNVRGIPGNLTSYSAALRFARDIKIRRFKTRKKDQTARELLRSTHIAHIPQLFYFLFSKNPRTVVYPDRAHVFLLGRPAVSTELPIYPLPDVPGALRCRYDVKRRWRGSSFLEITDPKFAPGELPLDIGAFLIASYAAN